MKKTLIALMALAGVAAAFDDTVWDFESNLASKTGTGYHEAGTSTYGKFVTTETSGTDENGNPTTTETTSWTAGTAVYADSGLVAGAKFGSYTLSADLGKALVLSEGSYVKVGDAYWSSGAGTLNPGTNSYTLMAWVKFDDVASTQAIFGTGDEKGKGMKFGIHKSNVANTTGSQLDLTAKFKSENRGDVITLQKNTWYNVAVSYNKDTSTASYYLNGSLVGTNVLSEGYNGTGGAGAAIGSGTKDESQDIFSGSIAQLQILSGAKTQAQILQAANLVPEPTTATLSLLALAGLAARRRRK